jgi:hypothetical protein
MDVIDAAPDLHYVRGTMVRVVEVLRAKGHTEAANDILPRAVGWFENQPPAEKQDENHRVWYARALTLAGRLDEAQRVCDGLVDDFPDVVEYRGLRGFVSASRGDSAQARAEAEWLEQLDRAHLLGAHTQHRGHIAGALGEREEAVNLLRQAFSEGIWYWWWRDSSVETSSLHDYPPFQELMRPKG